MARCLRVPGYNPYDGSMQDAACIGLLQDVLPRLHMRWAGFRKVRRQVCKRIDRRLRALGLPDAAAYRAYLDAHPDEWTALDALCRVTISRFYRDRGVFDALREAVLPDLAERALSAGEDTLRCWSAGCASGEEVYTLTILWARVLQPRFPGLALHVTATDADAHLLERARRAWYPAGTLKDLPEAWREAAFTRQDHAYCLRPAYRANVAWRRQDVRRVMPAGPFHLVLCRNLVFTYFDEALQRRCLRRLAARTAPGGVLVVGKHEALPDGAGDFAALDAHRGLYRKIQPKKSLNG